MPEPSAVEKAVKDLKDPRVRSRGLEFLLQSEEPQATEALWNYLPRLNLSRQVDASAAARVITALGDRGDARAVKGIVELLRKPLPEQQDKEIRRAALAALQKLNGKQALPFLRAALFSDKWRGFEQAIAAMLIGLGGGGEEDVLIRAVESATPAAKMAAIEALAALSGQRAQSVLEQAASAEEEQIRAAAQKALDARAAGEVIIVKPVLPPAPPAPPAPARPLAPTAPATGTAERLANRLPPRQDNNPGDTPEDEKRRKPWWKLW
jgi:HEAT repeat protein